ncbi:antibiotic biosynthesis monooxygenase [Jannaschia sp. CCS1]|uniref:antibiotic biosynthesis monooxygenase n=1 Tax=Jannaschia sp. (strain CCS1) TaxID=290400 RepID=UPI000053C669|nr:antibiotic biosynthesis monooxygenase [Jannaschia sp. CCS1]ABD56398.1 Antibiotic biosynthesis monooxygenase [Jannaschia sp. CCS1]
MADGATSQFDPVTVVVRRRVRPGQEAGYEHWLETLLTEVQGFPGYLGTDVQKPRAPDRTYVSIFRFDTPENLARFERSELRRRHLIKVAPYIEGDAIWERLSGLEIWFAPPPGTLAPQPVRWRMALVLIVLVTALVLLLGAAVSALPVTLADPLRVIVIVTAQVLLLTYLIMPRVTRWLAPWLF